MARQTLPQLDINIAMESQELSIKTRHIKPGRPCSTVCVTRYSKGVKYQSRWQDDIRFIKISIEGQAQVSSFKLFIQSCFVFIYVTPCIFSGDNALQ